MGWCLQLLVFTVALSAYLICDTYAFTCYACESEAKCNDPFKASNYHPTNDSCGQCFKQKIHTEDGGNQNTRRECLPQRTDPNSCNVKADKQKAGYYVTTCYCTANNCNSSPYITVSMATSICAGMVLLLAKIM